MLDGPTSIPAPLPHPRAAIGTRPAPRASDGGVGSSDYAPGRIVFGAGRADRIADEVVALGHRVFVVCGRAWAIRSGRLERIVADLAAAGGTAFPFPEVEPDPSLATIERGAALVRERRSDAVLAVGGGSAIDAAKAIALRATNDGPATRYRGERAPEDPLPVVAVPTTAGTGSEVTPYAVMLDPASGRKVTIKDRRLVPAVAIVDPRLCLGAPAETIAAAGVDAFFHGLGAFLLRNDDPLTWPYAASAMRLALRHLGRFLADPGNAGAAEGMALAALHGGVAVSRRRTGVIHTMANHLGAALGLPHGVSLALCAPPALAWNLPHLPAARHDALAGLFGSPPGECREEQTARVLDGIRSLLESAGVAAAGRARLATAGPPDIDRLVASVATDAGLPAVNLAPYSLEEVRRLFREVLASAFVGAPSQARQIQSVAPGKALLRRLAILISPYFSRTRAGERP